MSRCTSFALAVAAAAILSGPPSASRAQQPAAAPAKKPVVVKVGDKAPEFAAKTDANKLWKSKDHVGKKFLVVYFYPADMTGGCTKQACAYRDALKTLKRKDVEIIGVSGDSVENHQHFKKAYELNFTLLADPEGKIARSFGVASRPGGSIDRVIDGKTIQLTRGITASRWTFVIGPDRTVIYKDAKVDAVKDSENVLKLINKIAPAA